MDWWEKRRGSKISFESWRVIRLSSRAAQDGEGPRSCNFGYQPLCGAQPTETRDVTRKRNSTCEVPRRLRGSG